MNRYQYQFNGSLKPRMSQIEGTVFIGTGGQVNYPDAYPVFPVGTGATGPAGQTGPPRGLMPGQATAAVPTGWQGGFSGVQGLLGGVAGGAGVMGVQRVATGTMVVQLADDWVRMDSCQLEFISGVTGGTAVALTVIDHTVGYGNTIATGGMTGWQGAGKNPKNSIFIQFQSTTSGLPVDPGLGTAFHIDIRLRDSLAGPQ